MAQFTDILVRLLADILVIPVIIIGAWSIFKTPRKNLYQKLGLGLMTGLSALLIAKIASLLYQGDRPFVELGLAPKAAYLNNPGFPSDHVLLVFTITAVVWASTKNKKLTLLLLILSSLIGIGRIVALVHTPIDVLGGIICAILAALIVYKSNFLKP